MGEIYEELKSNYQQSRDTTLQRLKEVKKRLYALGSLRLLVVVAAIGLCFLFTSHLYYVIGVSIAIFSILMWYDNRYQKEKVFLETAIRCDEDELKALDYDFSPFDGAPELTDATHSFTLDLDIFGTGSLFQSINRTCTNYGKKLLADWFRQPLKTKDDIDSRQDAVKELSRKQDFRRSFRIHGLIHSGKESDYDDIRAFVDSPAKIVNAKLWKTVRISIMVLWVALIVAVSCFGLTAKVLIWYYILTLLVSESKSKQASELQKQAGDKVKVLQAYTQLIKNVEDEDFSSPCLKSLQSVFLKGNGKASGQFRRFARLAGELEQRANLLVHFTLNPLLLWDISKIIQLEEWKKEHGQDAIRWIETLGEADALCSLATFAANHPDYAYPVIIDDYFKLEGKALGHPLMRAEQCVRNDVHIAKHPYFLIITGANMAGKSTYLRTLGVNFVLACTGAPVCAEALEVSPTSIVTSLRTTDSLNDNESYFFAELKRLKMIIDRLQQGERLFIVLDEILKGTNSVDKQKGSLALIEQFVRLDACGVIATHDLLLGELEKTFPQNIRNYRFEADIRGDHLEFSYRMQDGVARNMNAAFLMKKMGITL